MAENLEHFFIPFGNLEPNESLRIVLKDCLGISIAQEPPEWVEKITVPGQAELDSKIDAIKNEIERIQCELELILQERTKVRACLDALFQIGSPLEDAVQRLLEAMGGTVEIPLRKGGSDRYLSVQIGETLYKAVMEIKGSNKNQFDMKGFKQALQWREEAMLERCEDFRAIFIGNSGIQLPPSERENPFSDNWKKQAILHKVTVLTTTTLYEAYCKIIEGKLQKEKFWIDLFNTDGIYKLPEAEPQKLP